MYLVLVMDKAYPCLWKTQYCPARPTVKNLLHNMRYIYSECTQAVSVWGTGSGCTVTHCDSLWHCDCMNSCGINDPIYIPACACCFTGQIQVVLNSILNCNNGLLQLQRYFCILAALLSYCICAISKLKIKKWIDVRCKYISQIRKSSLNKGNPILWSKVVLSASTDLHHYNAVH